MPVPVRGGGVGVDSILALSCLVPGRTAETLDGEVSSITWTDLQVGLGALGVAAYPQSAPASSSEPLRGAR